MQMQKMNSKITKTKTKTYSIWLTIHNSHNYIFFLLPLELSVQFSCVQLQMLIIKIITVALTCSSVAYLMYFSFQSAGESYDCQWSHFYFQWQTVSC